MDLVINEEEATWVRELFYKVIQEGARDMLWLKC